MGDTLPSALLEDEAKKFNNKGNVSWVQEVRKRRETEVGPSPEDIDKFGLSIVDILNEDIKNDHIRYLDDTFFYILASFRAFAQGGKSIDGRKPIDLYEEVLDFTPEDFDALVDVIYTELSKSFAPWVEEVKEIRHKEGGPSKEKMDELVKFYQKSKQELELDFNDRYEFQGPGRDLKVFAIGRTTMGETPVDKTSKFANLLPEDFLELVYRVNFSKRDTPEKQ